MTPITAIIVDDEPVARRTLHEYCARDPGIHITGEYGDSGAALAAIRQNPPGMLFLDVQMTPVSGLEIARALNRESLPYIVFVTAYDRYAVEAFDVSAVDYLLKPFDESRFHSAVARVRQRHASESFIQRQEALTQALNQLERNTKLLRDGLPHIIAESDGRTHVLEVGSIEMIESDGNYVRLTVGREVYKTRSTLLQAERSLASVRMIKISHSCLVNFNHIRELSRTRRGDIILILRGGTTVTSSERYRATVREQFEQMQIGRQGF